MYMLHAISISICTTWAFVCGACPASADSVKSDWPPLCVLTKDLCSQTRRALNLWRGHLESVQADTWPPLLRGERQHAPRHPFPLHLISPSPDKCVCLEEPQGHHDCACPPSSPRLNSQVCRRAGLSPPDPLWPVQRLCCLQWPLLIVMPSTLDTCPLGGKVPQEWPASPEHRLNRAPSDNLGQLRSKDLCLPEQEIPPNAQRKTTVVAQKLCIRNLYKYTHTHTHTHLTWTKGSDS